MTREELHDMAGLDSLGLLDPHERDAFETAFARATSEVQAEIRRLQDSIVGLGESLPNVEPDPTLRHRVVSAVSRVMEQDLVESMQRTAWSAGGYADRHDWVERLVAGRVSPVWRVAALIFAGVTLVVSWLAYDVLTTQREITRIVVENKVDEWVTQEVGGVQVTQYLLHPDFQAMLDSPVGADGPYGQVFYIASTGKVLFVARNVPASTEPYRLYAARRGSALQDAKAILSLNVNKDGTLATLFDTEDSLASAIEDSDFWVLGAGPAGNSALGMVIMSTASMN